MVGEMAEERSITQKLDRGLVVAIVRSYVAKSEIAADQLGSLITTVHRALGILGMTTPPTAAEALTPAVSIRRSVPQDHVVCLQCGFRGQTLRRHLRVRHGLDVAAYRVRWKLPVDHPLTAPAYSEHRAAMAKQLGLGRQPTATEEAEAPIAPARRGRPRRQTEASA
jgi:predicted transcriptional regulator